MRDQHLLAELLSVTGSHNLRRDSRQITITIAIPCVENQWHQSRPRLPHLDAKLPSQVVSKRGCANLRNRQPPGRHRQHRRPKLSLRRAHCELCPSRYLENPGLQENLNLHHPAFFLQHIENFARRAIAKQLSQFFLVIWNPVLLHQRNEVGGGVSRQSRLGKVWIRRKKIFRLALKIGEIASPSARDQDLLPQPVAVLKQRHASPALARLDRTHQSRGPTTENQSVKRADHEITCRTN